MTIQRMDNVLIVVDDLDAVISFFVELGMELDSPNSSAERTRELVTAAKRREFLHPAHCDSG